MLHYILFSYIFHGNMTVFKLFIDSAWMHAKLLQSCPTLWEPMDYSLPGSPVHGILQARILEWAIWNSPGDSPKPRIERGFLMSPVLAGGLFTTRTTEEAHLPTEADLNYTIVVQLLIHSWLFVTSWTVTHQASCPSSPQTCSNSCPLSWWWHPTISSSVAPFSSCLQS